MGKGADSPVNGGNFKMASTTSLPAHATTSIPQHETLSERKANQLKNQLGIESLPPLPPMPPENRRYLSAGRNKTDGDLERSSSRQEGEREDGIKALSKVKTATEGILARAARSKSIRGRRNRDKDKDKDRDADGTKTPKRSPDKLEFPREQIPPLPTRTDIPQQLQVVDEHSHQRPSISRSSSSEKTNLLSKFRAQGQTFMAHRSENAKLVAEKGQKAWAKFKKGSLNVSKGVGHTHSHSMSKSAPRKPNKPPIDVFNMGLKEATLGTRVACARDELNLYAYWIPAIAFRCIEFLNIHGPMEVGIYRIPGSTAVVDELKSEFIHEHDVDLLENPPMDIHTVSSLLKAWFRSLPESILPTEVQSRVYEKCKDHANAPHPPREFIDEISNLPPYNYYLLKALFAHLRDVNLASETNKMNLANLGMVFCSTLRIDRFCFNWLVMNWQDCWDGCNSELEEYERIKAAAAATRPESSLDARSDQQSISTQSPAHPSPDYYSAARSVPSTASSPAFPPSPSYTASPPGPPTPGVPSTDKSIPSPIFTDRRPPSHLVTEPPTPHYRRPPSENSPPPPPPTPMFSNIPRSMPEGKESANMSTGPTPFAAVKSLQNTSSNAGSSGTGSAPSTPTVRIVPREATTKKLTPPPPPPPRNRTPPTNATSKPTTTTTTVPIRSRTPPKPPPPPPAAVASVTVTSASPPYTSHLNSRHKPNVSIDTTSANLLPLLPEIAPISPLMGGGSRTPTPVATPTRAAAAGKGS